jgi:hypothetical protein
VPSWSSGFVEARAESEQAQSEAKAAQSRARMASDCAKAYVGAFGGLFERESAKDQAPAIREELSQITADCKDAFAAA